MPKFYMTFGANQPLEGYVLPIVAKTHNQAREYMEKWFDNHYCTSYTEDGWENYKKQAREHFFPVEKELETVILNSEEYETKLKPCPFCGSEAVIKSQRMNAISLQILWTVECDNMHCQIKPYKDGCKTEQEAIEAWNTRKREEE